MHIEIQARGFTLTQAIRGYVERRLARQRDNDRALSLKDRQPASNDNYFKDAS